MFICPCILTVLTIISFTWKICSVCAQVCVWVCVCARMCVCVCERVWFFSHNANSNWIQAHWFWLNFNRIWTCTCTSTFNNNYNNIAQCKHIFKHSWSTAWLKFFQLKFNFQNALFLRMFSEWNGFESKYLYNGRQHTNIFTIFIEKIWIYWYEIELNDSLIPRNI